MTDPSDTTALLAAERALQVAQLAADADALDRLLDERCVFAGPDGRLYSKQDDLDIQRSGQQRLTRVDADEVTGVVEGTTGVTWFLGTVAGAVGEQHFDQRVRYTRTWTHTTDRAGSSSPPTSARSSAKGHLWRGPAPKVTYGGSRHVKWSPSVVSERRMRHKVTSQRSPTAKGDLWRGQRTANR